VHGAEAKRETISGYYLAGELAVSWFTVNWNSWWPELAGVGA